MVSHHHKTIFIHIPKCAGQSIEAAFLDDLGLSWKTRAPLLLRPNPLSELGPPRLAHLLVREYVKFKYITYEQFNQYYKFSIVRCPISRVISMYNYISYGRKKEGFQLSLEQFVREWLPSQFLYASKYAKEYHRYEGDYHFVRPQYDYLTDEKGKLLVNHIYKLEDLKTQYPLIQSRCGLKAGLKHINAPKEKIAKLNDLKPRDIEVINTLYAVDFKLLEEHF